MKWRHLTRVLVLLTIAAVVLLNRYWTLKGQVGGNLEIESSRVYTWLDQLHGASPHRTAYEAVGHGSLWSFRLGPVRLSDPLAVIGEVVVLKSLSSTLMLSALIPVIATLLLGRVFCSWICPMGLLSEGITALRAGLARFGVNLYAGRASNGLKYIILATGLLFGLLASVRYFFWIYPPRILSDCLRDSLVGSVSDKAVVFIGVVLLCELLFVERLWCRCLCPGGALYSLLGRWRIVRIWRDPETCTSCLECDRACPHDLTPSHLPLEGECDNCGLCRATCEPRALHYQIMRRPRSRVSDADEHK